LITPLEPPIQPFESTGSSWDFDPGQSGSCCSIAPMKRSVTAIGLAAVLGVVGVLSCGSDPDCTTGTVRIEAIAPPANLPAGGGTVTVQVELNGTIVASATGTMDASTGSGIVDVPLPNYRGGDEVLLRAHLSDSTGRVVGTWFNLVTLPSGCLSTEANLFLMSFPDGGVSDARAPMMMRDAMPIVNDASPMDVLMPAADASALPDAAVQSPDAGDASLVPEDGSVDAP
jgi:hypothetical protein